MHRLVSYMGILIEKYHNIESAINKVILDKLRESDVFCKCVENINYVATEYLDSIDFEQSQ